MDALELLKKDHDEVKKMLEELDSTSEVDVEKRHGLFGRVKTELGAHEDIEEAIFYPALKEHPKRPCFSWLVTLRALQPFVRKRPLRSGRYPGAVADTTRSRKNRARDLVFPTGLCG